jgi:hypothetical protein
MEATYPTHADVATFILSPIFVGQKPVLNPHNKYNRKAEEVPKWQPKNEAHEAANDLSGKRVAQHEHQEA